MHHAVKYVLVLAILMSGFYLARKFRVPDDVGSERSAVADGEAADAPAFLDDAGGAPVGSQQLPVAALVDVDKIPTRDSIESELFGNPRSVENLQQLTEEPTLRKQATTDTSSPARRSDNSPAGRPGPAQQAGARPQSGSATGQGERAPRVASRSPSDFSTSTAGAAKGSTGSKASHKAAAGGDGYDELLPDFADHYQPWLDPLDESAQTDRDADTETAAARHRTASDNPAPRSDDPRRHQIEEGDTLSELAREYLGDPERQLEIYEANREVLFHPRLLPIGIEIVIPACDETALADATDVVSAGPDAQDLWGQAFPADAGRADDEAQAERTSAGGGGHDTDHGLGDEAWTSPEPAPRPKRKRQPG
jgi:nucleoid-associated protein YgaU